MATFTKLPSGKWRVQVRKASIYKAATFATKREAKDWSITIEAHISHISSGGFAPVPKQSTVADLIDKYAASFVKNSGRTKVATLNMLKREICSVKLSNLNAVVLRDFIDRRQKSGAGGVTIGADLSYLSGALKWGRHARHLDLPERLALEARASLIHRGLDTRGKEREREPTDDELERLYKIWDNSRLRKVPMTMLCKFAIATGMRQAEICRLEIEDIDRKAKTVIIRDRKDPKQKIGNNQTVPLLPEAWSIVEPLIKDRDSGFLFPYQPDSVSAAFTRGCKAVEPPIIDLHFHDLRHKATASFFRMGLDIPRVALLTGHKTWAMLRRYTKITPNDVHNSINKVDSHATGKEGNV